MASMKTMMMMALDVGPSMKESVSSTSKHSKLSLAKAFMGHFILQRMMASKTVEFGVATFGDNETNNYLNSNQGGYEGVNEIWPMSRPSQDTLSNIHNISIGEQSGDLIDGVVVSQDALIRVNAGKAFNRLMLIITDGETEVQGVDDLETIVAQMKTIKNFAIYIAMIGKVNNASNIIKRENAKLLKSIAANVNGRYMEIEELAESFHLLSAGLGLGTKPVVSKTVLEVSPNLKIPVCYWSKVSKATAPTLKKQSKNSPAQADSAVKRDISYRNPEDPDQEIPDEEKVKGFKYGNQYVPVNSADEDKFKIPGSPILQVIGFIPAKDIPRFHYLDGPTYVYPNQELDVAQTAVQAFTTAMRTKERVALVRFVKRDSSDPALMALLPKKDHLGRDCFLMHRIPCAEDVREYNFPSLISFASESQVRNNATLRTQKTAMFSFVQSMMVETPNQQMLSCANPSIHRVYADIHRRLIKEDDEQMVAVEPGFVALNTPAMASSLNDVYQHFPLKRSEKSSDRKKVFWSDIEIKTTGDHDANRKVKIEIDGQQIAAALSGQAATSADSSSSVAVDLPEFTVGSVTPIEDLEQLTEAIQSASLGDSEKRSKISDALCVMTKVVERNITVGASKPHYKRAVECLAALRSTSVRVKDADVYNNFLRNTMKGIFSKGRHSLVWQMVIEDKLTLISSHELDSSNVSKNEADEFFNDKFVVEVPVTTVVVADEEEDLFGNME